jgi:ABC-type lipoprotein export system ATPase subunit
VPLTLSDIDFRYPGSETELLQGVSLEVAAGESVAVMAPSGRGKTTLLWIAGLLLKPTTGRVEIDRVERTPADAAELLGSTVSWVLQSVNLLPRRTVIDNVALPLLAHEWPEGAARERARDLLSVVGLASCGGRTARTLSGGEAQRVGVARALATQPSVLLADEPTANLDGATARSVAAALFEASTETALVVTTHDAAVGRLATRRVYISERGRLTED